MTLKSPLNAALDSRKHPATQHCRKLVKKLNNWNLQLYINLYSFFDMKKLGKYTKEELNLLENMYLDDFTIYKIARDLRRSQKSVRNNLIRLRLVKPPY